MTTSASGRSACRFGAFLSIIILVTMAVLVAAPSTSEAKTQLWLYPDVDDPRAGGHVVTDGMFTLVVENRGRGDDDTAYDVSLVVAVNNPDLLDSFILEWPDGSTMEVGDLQFGTPTRPCDGKYVPRHGVYPAEYTTVPIFSTGSPPDPADPAAEIPAGDTVEINVEVVGQDGLEIHFDVIAQGFKIKKEIAECYGVVNPSGHDVTVILGEAVEAECPAVTIDKSADTTGVDIDDEVVYTIEVESSEDCDPLGGVIVTENLPTVIDPETGNPVPAFTVMEVVPNPDPTNGTADMITWTLTPDLAPGGSEIFTVTVKFDQPLTDGHKVVNTACVALAGNEDPEECSRAAVAVGVNANDGDMRGPGFWCNRIRFAFDERHNATYTVEDLEAFLDEINDDDDTGEGSSVFSELYDTSTLELAQTLLCYPQLAESAADRLTRHLLTLWFNIVSDRIDPALTLDELCPGDEELPEDSDGGMTVGEVVAGAEEALWADPPDDALLDWWKDVIDSINNSDCDEVDEPVSQMRRSQGRRLGRH
jgi:hypothetical protein